MILTSVYGLPYLAVSCSEITFNSATSVCNRGATQMRLDMGSANPSSKVLKYKFHLTSVINISR